MSVTRQIVNSDIAIVGGGMVGLSMAHALAKYTNGLKCVVLDAQHKDALFSPEADNRGLALSLNSILFFKEINLWQDLAKFSFPIKQIHISEKAAFGFSKILAADYNIPQLGVVIPASKIGKHLSDHLSSANLSVYWQQPLQQAAYVSQDNLWQLYTDNYQVNAKFIIAADGMNSKIRALQGIAVDKFDYQQTAIVCNVQVSDALDATAFQRFSCPGTLAMLPFGDKIKSVWSISSDKAEQLMDLSDRQYLQVLQDNFGFRQGKLISVSKRFGFPIKLSQAQSITGVNCALIGNAANAMHPVAAQGLNSGIKDVQSLAKLIASGTEGYQLLNKYHAARYEDMQTTVKYCHQLATMFEVEQLLPRLARRFGLITSNFSSILNSKIALWGMT